MTVKLLVWLDVDANEAELLGRALGHESLEGAIAGVLADELLLERTKVAVAPLVDVERFDGEGTLLEPAIGEIFPRLDLDHCPVCGDRVLDSDRDGYERTDGRRGHRRCDEMAIALLRRIAGPHFPIGVPL